MGELFGVGARGRSFGAKSWPWRCNAVLLGTLAFALVVTASSVAAGQSRTVASAQSPWYMPSTMQPPGAKPALKSRSATNARLAKLAYGEPRPTVSNARLAHLAYGEQLPGPGYTVARSTYQPPPARTVADERLARLAYGNVPEPKPHPLADNPRARRNGPDAWTVKVRDKLDPNDPMAGLPPDIVEQLDKPEAPFFDFAFGTLAPLSIGGQGTIELPGRLLAQVEGGWMPPAYSTAINDVVQAFGAYDEGVAGLIDGALQRAVVVRTSAGWRPFPTLGIELTGGYTYIHLSGSVNPVAVADVVGGQVAADVAARLIQQDVDISSQLHNVHVTLGYRWVAWDHLVIRANIGYLQTLASSTSLESEERSAHVSDASSKADERLGEIYKTYAKLPTGGLSAGVRF